MKFRNILSALLHLFALSSAALADETHNVPTSVSGGSGTAQSVRFDHAYLVITHTTPLFAPPTWSDEFDDSGPPNPAVWTFEQGFVRNEELQWYQTNNAWQENGNLIIEGRREQVLNPNYRAGSSDWRINRR